MCPAALLLLALLPGDEPETLTRQRFKEEAVRLTGDRRFFHNFGGRSCLAAQVLIARGLDRTHFPCHVSRQQLLMMYQTREAAGRVDVQLRVLSPGQLRSLRGAASPESLRGRLAEMRDHYDRLGTLAAETPSLRRTEVPARLRAVRDVIGLTVKSIEGPKQPGKGSPPPDE